jgi:transketolase
MPSWEVFDKQSDEYKEKVLPSSVKNILSVETGVKQGWEKYVGDAGDSVSLEHFGASAPYETIYQEFGFTPENIAARAEELIQKNK